MARLLQPPPLQADALAPEDHAATAQRQVWRLRFWSVLAHDLPPQALEAFDERS